MQYYSLKIIELRPETSDTCTIVFKQPALKKISYQAGQYLSLVFRINGRQYIRPYSFSSAPTVDSDIEVTIKRVSGGVVSNHVIDTLKPGDVVQVIEPHGDFVLQNHLINECTKLMMWGSGSGITPLMSLIKYALKNNIGKEIVLVYGNRHAETVIFNDRIAALETEFPQLKVLHFHTRLSVSPNNPNVVEGRIDPAKALTIIDNITDFNNTLHYICGPAGLKESIKNVLAEFNVGSDRIFSEDFEVVRDPKQFHDVVTAKVSIALGGVQHTIEVVKGKSVLEAGLDALIEMPYSCQTGNCAICKGRLTAGKLKNIGADEKHLSSLQHNEHLLCCSFPSTEHVEIEID